MSLTESQKQAIEDSNNFDWDNAQPINAGQGALNNQNKGYSFSLTNPATGVSFNTISPTLGKLNLSRGLGDIVANTPMGVNRKYAKPITSNKPNNTNASKTEDTSKASKTEDTSKVADEKKKEKKKFMDTRFGQVLGSTPLGMATRAVVDTVKERKAKRAEAKKNNK